MSVLGSGEYTGREISRVLSRRLFLDAVLLTGGAGRSALASANRRLLDDIAAAYESILDYRIEVDVIAKPELDSEPVSRTVYMLVRSKPHCWFSHERVIVPSRYEVFLGAGDDTAWGYDPRQKRYVIDSSHSMSDQKAAVQKHHTLFFTRFESLNRSGGKFSVVGKGRQSDGVAKKHCTVLRLEPLDRQTWTEDLWVEEERHLILKSIFRERTFWGKRTITATWRLISINGGMDKPLFRFKPPQGAQRTNAIEIR
jgi:hypothetical protein